MLKSTVKKFPENKYIILKIMDSVTHKPLAIFLRYINLSSW